MEKYPKVKGLMNSLHQSIKSWKKNSIKLQVRITNTINANQLFKFNEIIFWTINQRLKLKCVFIAQLYPLINHFTAK